MKKIILWVTFVLASFAAGTGQALPRLVDTSTPGENTVARFPAGIPTQRVHKEEWSPVTPAVKLNKSIASGSWTAINMFMPVSGQCLGSFETVDAKPDATADQSQGDVEVMIMDHFQYDNFKGDRSFSSRNSSGRTSSAEFDAPLAAGRYVIVISNKHSLTERKSANFTLGRRKK